MSLRIYSGALLVFAVMIAAFVGCCGSADAQAEMSDFDSLYASGKAHYDAGDYSSALDELAQASAIRPDDVGANFYYGMAASQSGDFETAVLAFERVLIINPNLPRVKAELGRCYFSMKQYALAESYFSDIAEEDLPENVRLRVDGYLNKIASLQKKHSLSGQVVMGVSRDTNVRISPADDTVSTIIGDVVLDNDYRRQVDFMYSLSVALEHAYSLDSEGALRWETGLSNYNAFYDTEDELDLRYMQITSGPAYRGERMSLSLRALAGLLERDDASYLRSLGGIATGGYILGRNMAVAAEIRVEDRKYHQYPDRDGTYYRTAFGPTMVAGRSTVSCQLGFEGTEAAESSESYDAFFASLAAEREIGDWFLAFAKYQFKVGKYDGDDPLFGRRREDDEHEMTIGVRRKIMENTTAILSHTYTDVDSAISLYEYDRNVTNFSIIVEF